jgi:hypothetical protein
MGKSYRATFDHGAVAERLSRKKRGSLPAVDYRDGYEAGYSDGRERYLYNNLKQRMYFPVMQDGLINKYRIPPNYLERCIMIDMPKRRPGRTEETVEDLEFFDLLEEVGDGFRKPRLEWVSQISREDTRERRAQVKANWYPHARPSVD